MKKHSPQNLFAKSLFQCSFKSNDYRSFSSGAYRKKREAELPHHMQMQLEHLNVMKEYKEEKEDEEKDVSW